MHLPFIAQTRAHQMYVRLKRVLCFIVKLISIQDVMAGHCGSTLKDKLCDPRGSFANNIPSHVIEQANREVRQDNHHSQHTSNT